MQTDSNVLYSPNWVWCCESANINLTIGYNATGYSLVVCMMSGALYPLNIIENNFTF